ncbi:hypothetical protein TNCT_209841 [Trichonephila clavata]|uniref:Uncharacterized protein n=1 Tax=Trichonephila clavata TaxID=2740835 RepID=A0A8X6HZH2_TRICU|nr:hypothetical protein TNCT_209841 [Trichonephila clavata]
MVFAGPYKLFNRWKNLTVVHKNPQWAPQLTTREMRGTSGQICVPKMLAFLRVKKQNANHGQVEFKLLSCEENF